MTQKDKRFYRELKRYIKQEGNKRRRAFFKKNLLDNPEEAHLCENYDFGEFSSAKLNGIDNKNNMKEYKEKIVLPQETNKDDDGTV